MAKTEIILGEAGGGDIPVESITLFYYKLSSPAGILLKSDTNPLRPYSLKVWNTSDTWPIAGEYLSVTWTGLSWQATILKAGYFSVWENGVYTDKVYKNVNDTITFTGFGSPTDLNSASWEIIAWA